MENLNEKQKNIIDMYVKKMAKPCYAIEVVEGEPTQLDSSIGGIPYLPIGENLPVNEKGEKMPLFVQLNLEGIDLDDYPNKGILQVFLENQGGYPTEYKVRYYENIETDFQKNVEVIDNEWVSIPLKVKLNKSESFLPPYDCDFDKCFLSIYNEVMGTKFNIYNEVKDYDSIVEELYGLKIPGNFGGYADSTQSQEFDYDQNEVLVKIDSDLNRNICIGDAGILWVLITKENLKSGKITEAWVDWDCC